MTLFCDSSILCFSVFVHPGYVIMYADSLSLCSLHVVSMLCSRIMGVRSLREGFEKDKDI